MRGTLLIRDIKKSMAVFCSIAIVVALGLLLYLGIAFASVGIKDTMDDYYRTSSYMDAGIFSADGFTKEDMEAVSALSEVKETEGSYEANAYLSIPEDPESNKLVVSAISLTSSISKANLLDGRFPEGVDECVIEEPLGENIKIGDKIRLDDGNSQGIGLLKEQEFTVTGIVSHPDALMDVEERRGISTLGNGCIENFVFLDQSAFDDSLFGGGFQTLLMKGNYTGDTYGTGYERFLDRLQEKLEDLGKERVGEDADGWQISRRDEAISYIAIGMSADNITTVGNTFGLIFLVISVMVCYTSSSRKIREQRPILGMEKARGFRTGEIMGRYLAYSSMATLLGILLGGVLSYAVMQPVLVKGYLTNTSLVDFARVFLPGSLVLAAAAALVINLAATTAAVWHTLHSSASELMRGIKHRMGRTAKIGGFLRRTKLPLRQAMAVKNLFFDLGRTITTVLIIAGCLTLICIGVSLKFSSGEILGLQFKGLVNYDRVLTADTRFGDEEELQNGLAELEEATHLPVFTYATGFRFGKDSNMACITVAEPSKINDYYALQDPYSGESLTLPDDGVLLSVRGYEYFGIEPGDELEITQADGKRYSLEVKGCFDNYIDHVIFMSPEYYKQVTGEDAAANQFYIKSGELTEGQLRSSLSEYDAFVSLMPDDYKRGQFEDLSGTMSMIMGIMIILSTVLAAVTLFNLNAMTLLQRSHELNMMRANGFTVKETKSYIIRENRLLTIIGIIIGCFTGSALYEFVRSGLESDTVKLPSGVSVTGLLTSIVITLVLAEVMQAIFLAGLKKKQRIRMED
ncbi:MAG: FtsX-like permease family protein [Bacillota bacterium]|nr:FtsX-like permease family protein [Bacillota bacterium]